MPSDPSPEFDDSHPSTPEDATEHWPDDPGKTWVPEDRGSNAWADTGDLPAPPPETEAGSRDGLSAADDVGDSPADAEPPREFGNYELLEHIGRGGMGNVYKAHDRRLDRIVALKTLRAGTERQERQIERFVREAKAAARLDHPNIVPCYEFGEFEGWHYLTMAYIQGESLQHRLESGPLKPHEAALMIQALAGAVSHAHKQGVIHRDIKPGNVLLGEDGRPRLTDFGIAKLIDPTDRPVPPEQLTLVGEALGTPGYMAPEQSAGRRWEVGPAVDIYGLGGVLVAALTGHPATLNSLETLPQEIPAELQMISKSCLAHNPIERYAAADNLLEDLETYLKENPIPATSPPPSEKEVTMTLPEVTIKFSKTKIGLIVGFIVAVLVCSFLLATWFTDGWRDAGASPRNGRAPAESSEGREGIRAFGSPGDEVSPSAGPIRSHLEVMVENGLDPSLRLKEPNTLPLQPGDVLIVNVKVDRVDDAFLYLIRVNPLGEVEFVNEGQPIELMPARGHYHHAPEELPHEEHFVIHGKTETPVPLDRTGPAGMMTVLLLSRKEPLSDEMLKQIANELDSLTKRQQPAPADSALQRFSYRQGRRILHAGPSMREPLSSEHAVVRTLSELVEILTPYSEHIEAVSFAVPALQTPPTEN